MSTSSTFTESIDAKDLSVFECSTLLHAIFTTNNYLHEHQQQDILMNICVDISLWITTSNQAIFQYDFNGYYTMLNKHFYENISQIITSFIVDPEQYLKWIQFDNMPKTKLIKDMTGDEFVDFMVKEVCMEADDLDKDWPSIVQRMEQVWQKLLKPEQLIINVTVDEAALPDTLKKLGSFIEQIPSSERFIAQKWKPNRLPESEALTAPTQVNYVGCSANLFQVGYTLHGSALVITRYLQTAWLWEKIRVQGGAYGGGASQDLEQLCGRRERQRQRQQKSGPPETKVWPWRRELVVIDSRVFFKEVFTPPFSLFESIQWK